VRSIQTFFTHRSVSTLDRSPFQLTDELEWPSSDAEKLVADWTPEEKEYLRHAVTKDALQTPFRDGTVQDVAIEMVKIAKEGLRRRGANEENFVDGLMEIATTGKTSSDLLLEAYENEWGEDIDKVFKKLSY
jgi:glutamate--cysteine ligase